jgi:hypothetical protein
VKRVLSIVMLTLLAAGFVVGGIGLLLPRHYLVERSTIINARPEQIHPFVEQLSKWEAWANWSKRDPTLEHGYEGPERGVGATHRWRGERTGFGSLTLIASDPQTGVKFEERLEGSDVNGRGSITYAADRDVTTVTWRDEGELPPVIGGFFVSEMQEGLGRHFEEGLRRLKDLVEQSVADNPK